MICLLPRSSEDSDVALVGLGSSWYVAIAKVQKAELLTRLRVTVSVVIGVLGVIPRFVVSSCRTKYSREKTDGPIGPFVVRAKRPDPASEL